MNNISTCVLIIILSLKMPRICFCCDDCENSEDSENSENYKDKNCQYPHVKNIEEVIEIANNYVCTIVEYAHNCNDCWLRLAEIDNYENFKRISFATSIGSVITNLNLVPCGKDNDFNIYYSLSTCYIDQLVSDSLEKITVTNFLNYIDTGEFNYKYKKSLGTQFLFVKNGDHNLDMLWDKLLEHSYTILLIDNDNNNYKSTNDWSFYFAQKLSLTKSAVI